MLLSVLVPIYNVSKYLTQCLESLKSQSIGNMEILCINDGSTDDSKSIIERFVKEDSRFILIDKPNTGYGNSMNVGLNQASGEYIAIVESDDFIEFNMMEQLVELITITKADMVKSDFFLFDDISNKSRLFDCFKGFSIGTAIKGIEHPDIFFMTQSIWSGIYRSDFLKKNNIRFHETPGASFQDISFAFQVLANAESIVLTQEAYYHYRTSNPNSSVKMLYKLDKLCVELDYLESLVINHHNRLKLEPIASRLVYKVLLENYHDAYRGYQFAFLCELERRLKRYKLRGDLNKDAWDDESVAIANEIISDKNAYYQKTGKVIFDNKIWKNTLNASIYKNAILTNVTDYSRIVLYGAGIVGNTTKDELLKLGVSKEKMIFAVTVKDEILDIIDGIPVKQVDELKDSGDDTIFVITAKESRQYEMYQNLLALGIKKIVYLSDDVRCLLTQNVQSEH